MNRKRKVALVGVGGRGAWVVEAAAANPSLELVALVDLNAQAITAARERLGLPDSVVYRDIDQALSQSEAEAVIICTPMSTHGRLCRSAFSYGVPVLVEKGMTFSWDEACDLVAEADAVGVRFCVAQNYRYRAPMQALGAILEDSAHPHYPGEVSMVDCFHHRYRPDPHTSTYPYAMVWDMGCHHFDLLISWLGPLQRVSAHSYKTRWSRYAHDPNISAFLEFQNGAVANYVLTHDAMLTKFGLNVQGERGALRYGDDVDGLVFHPTPEKALRSGAPVRCEVPDGPGDAAMVLEAFFQYIEHGTEPGISGRRNLETMAACAMLVKSASARRDVERTELPEPAAVC